MKKLFACALILLLAAGLSGCQKETTLSPDAPVTLTMWHGIFTANRRILP